MLIDIDKYQPVPTRYFDFDVNNKFSPWIQINVCISMQCHWKIACRILTDKNQDVQ